MKNSYRFLFLNSSPSQGGSIEQAEGEKASSEQPQSLDEAYVALDTAITAFNQGVDTRKGWFGLSEENQTLKDDMKKWREGLAERVSGQLAMENQKGLTGEALERVLAETNKKLIAHINSLASKLKAMIPTKDDAHKDIENDMDALHSSGGIRSISRERFDQIREEKRNVQLAEEHSAHTQALEARLGQSANERLSELKPGGISGQEMVKKGERGKRYTAVENTHFPDNAPAEEMAAVQEKAEAYLGQKRSEVLSQIMPSFYGEEGFSDELTTKMQRMEKHFAEYTKNAVSGALEDKRREGSLEGTVDVEALYRSSVETTFLSTPAERESYAGKPISEIILANTIKGNEGIRSLLAKRAEDRKRYAKPKPAKSQIVAQEKTSSGGSDVADLDMEGGGKAFVSENQIEVGETTTDVVNFLTGGQVEKAGKLAKEAVHGRYARMQARLKELNNRNN